MALSGIELSAGIIVGTGSPLDSKYGPYSQLEDVNTSIPLTLRYQGLTVGVLVNNVVVEYWYKDGVADADLKLKQAAGGGSPVTLEDVLTEGNVSTKSIDLISPPSFGADRDWYLKWGVYSDETDYRLNYITKYDEFLFTNKGGSDGIYFTHVLNSTSSSADVNQTWVDPMFVFEAYRTNDTNMISRNSPNKIAYLERDLVDFRNAGQSYLRVGPSTTQIGNLNGNHLVFDEYNRLNVKANQIFLEATSGYYLMLNLNYLHTPTHMMSYNEFTGRVTFSPLPSGGGTQVTANTGSYTAVLTDINIDGVGYQLSGGAETLLSGAYGINTWKNGNVWYIELDSNAVSGINVNNDLTYLPNYIRDEYQFLLRWKYDWSSYAVFDYTEFVNTISGGGGGGGGTSITQYDMFPMGATFNEVYYDENMQQLVYSPYGDPWPQQLPPVEFVGFCPPISWLSMMQQKGINYDLFQYIGASTPFGWYSLGNEYSIRIVNGLIVEHMLTSEIPT